MIRRGIADVFTLIDLLVAAGRQDEAVGYMIAALKLNSWALNYQMQYAEIMEQRGEAEQAKEKATLVLDYAEQDDLCERAQRLLDHQVLPAIPAIQEAQDGRTTLVLVPVGSVDRYVLYELQKELSATLPISVVLQDAHVTVPEFKRDPVSKHLAEVRSNLLAGVKQDLRLASFLRQKGLTETALQQDGGVIVACRYLSFENGGTNALTQFDTGMQQLANAPKQWDVIDLLSSLKTAVRAFGSSNVYFMGVADLDAFLDQSNYIFGTAEINGRHAVITYRRFTAQFTGENPNRKRLDDRTLKQALSSFGLMLGAERCSTPTCARAYPHNLAEHDAKSREPCPTCRRAFEQTLGVTIKNTETDHRDRDAPHGAPLPHH
jgi:predicted Zn-dependent protease